jgi:hypothetical protein
MNALELHVAPGDVHRVDHIGEQNRDLLVLRRLSGVCNRRAALTTELGCRAQLRAARPTGEARRSQCTATVAVVVHLSIVSPLISGVRHIAAPSSIRSFETLICRLFRDGVQFCSGLVDLLVRVGRHGGGGHRLTLAGERFVGLVAEDIA